MIGRTSKGAPRIFHYGPRLNRPKIEAELPKAKSAGVGFLGRKQQALSPPSRVLGERCELL